MPKSTTIITSGKFGQKFVETFDAQGKVVSQVPIAGTGTTAGQTAPSGKTIGGVPVETLKQFKGRIGTGKDQIRLSELRKTFKETREQRTKQEFAQTFGEEELKQVEIKAEARGEKVEDVIKERRKELLGRKQRFKAQEFLAFGEAPPPKRVTEFVTTERVEGSPFNVQKNILVGIAEERAEPISKVRAEPTFREDAAAFVGTRAKRIFLGAQEKVSEKVKKFIPEVTEKREAEIGKLVTFAQVGGAPVGLLGFSPFGEPEKVTEVKKVKAISEAGFVTGFVTEAREEPLQFGGGFLLGAGTKVGVTALKTAGKVGKLVTKVEPIAGVSLGALFAGQTALEISKEPSKAPSILGEKTAEAAPFVAGFTRGGIITNPIERKLAGLTFEEQLVIKEEIEAIKSLPKQEQLKALFKIIRRTRDVDVALREVTRLKVEGIPPEQIRVVKKFLIDNPDTAIFGSLSFETSEVGLTRLARDIDIVAKNPSKSARELFNALKASGVKDIKLKGSKIEFSGQKRIEFKNVERVRKSFLLAEEVVTTPEGIQTITPREQVARKGFGAIQAFKGDIRRQKDIPDVFSAVNRVLTIGKEQAVTPFQKARFQRLQEAQLQTFLTGEITKPTTGLVKPFFETFLIRGKRATVIPRGIREKPSRPRPFFEVRDRGLTIFGLPSELPPTKEPSKIPSLIPPSIPPSKQPSILPPLAPPKPPSKIPPTPPSEPPTILPPTRIPPPKPPSKLPPIISPPIKIIPPISPPRMPPPSLFDSEEEERKKRKERKPKKVPFGAFVPNLLGIGVFEEQRFIKKEPKPSVVFTGFEKRFAPQKGLSISPLNIRKSNLLTAPKQNLFKRQKVDFFTFKKKKKRKKKR
jgi:hypothetical protein